MHIQIEELFASPGIGSGEAKQVQVSGAHRQMLPHAFVRWA
jgi:hypothetical protein